MKADRSGTWTEQKMYKMGYQTFKEWRLDLHSAEHAPRPKKSGMTTTRTSIAWPVILQLHQEPFATSTKRGRNGDEPEFPIPK